MPAKRFARRFGPWLALSGVLSVFVLWQLFVRAPAPARVCAHITELARQDSAGLSPVSQAGLLEQIESSCVAHKRNKILLRGRLAYARYAKCVMAAQTLAETDRC